MKLVDTAQLLAGGPGSGCRGDNCGRPRTSVVVTPMEPDHTYHQQFRSDTRVALMHEGKEIGYAELKHDGDKVRINQTFIDPEYRGQGFGKELYQHLIEHARKRGAKTLRSDHGVALSEDARRVWESMRRAEPDRVRKRSKGYVYQVQ